MWTKIKKWIYVMPITVFLVFAFGMMILTSVEFFDKYAEKEIPYEFESCIDFSNRFEEILQSNIFGKYWYINLNGKMARNLRINTVNKVQRLRNGFLAGFYGTPSVKESSQKVIELNNFLADRGVPFLYLLVPSKTSMYDVQFARGYGDNSKRNIGNMLKELNKAGILTINMDDWFRKNKWNMPRVFFKTDHHWKPQAGLAAARCTMDLLKKKGIADYDEEKLRDESYERELLKDWFLGSQGKRTGKYYVGVDDITVYYPKFKTDYSYSGLRRGTTNWEYSGSLLDFALIEKKNYFESDPYCIYLYGDRPLQIISNPLAENKKRLLIVGNSFRKPWQYFLATQFQEIHSIDLRFYTDGTFAQYIAEIKPDIVIMCLNSTGITRLDYNNFGLESYFAELDEMTSNFPVLELGDKEIQAKSDNDDNFGILYDNLDADTAYTLTVDKTVLEGTENSYIQMTLQNLTTNEAVCNRYFVANSDKEQRWIFSTPMEHDEVYGIYLYAGAKGHTAKIGVKVEGIRLQKGIYEE